MSERIVCWFSHGVASACATKLVIEENTASSAPKDLVVATIFLQDEHEDNERFRKECEEWFGQEVVILTREKYNSSVDEVIKQTRYMSGTKGARCTKELKKAVRHSWQQDGDIHVFGMTVEEQHRIDQLIDQENEINLWPILIEKGMTKQDCFDMFDSSGIDRPTMYVLGYNNNNCKGCLKATSPGYWNKVRQDFPEVFHKRAKQEELLGVSLIQMSANRLANDYPEVFIKMLRDSTAGKCSVKISSKGVIRVPLRYLPQDAGKHESMYVPDCGFFCEPASGIEIV